MANQRHKCKKLIAEYEEKIEEEKELNEVDGENNIKRDDNEGENSNSNRSDRRRNHEEEINEKEMGNKVIDEDNTQHTEETLLCTREEREDKKD